MRAGSDFLRLFFEADPGVIGIGDCVLSMKPAHVGQRTLGVAADGDQFGGNGDRDFFRSDGADIKADGRVDSFEERLGNSFCGEFAKDRNRFSF
jgi:hypothetical protein